MDLQHLTRREERLKLAVSKCQKTSIGSQHGKRHTKGDNQSTFRHHLLPTINRHKYTHVLLLIAC